MTPTDEASFSVMEYRALAAVQPEKIARIDIVQVYARSREIRERQFTND